MDYSVIACDKFIESYEKETKTIPANFNVKKATCKMQNVYIILSAANNSQLTINDRQ